MNRENLGSSFLERELLVRVFICKQQKLIPVYFSKINEFNESICRVYRIAVIVLAPGLGLNF